MPFAVGRGPVTGPPGHADARPRTDQRPARYEARTIGGAFPAGTST
jgi:hypothetical protein